jgi:putative ABC transport system permease protein
VRGVVADFHYQSLTSALGPLALRLDPAQFQLLHIRIPAGDPTPALAALESAWKKVDPVHPFKAEFFSEQVAKGYADIGTMATLISFFALLALSVSCLGLLGMVTFAVGRRTKEIGVRKVVGASVTQVALTLARQFLALLGIAVALAAPAGWFLGRLLLDNFAHRIDFHPGFAGACAAVVLAVGLLAVGAQAVRAALANPVSSLKSE